MVVLKQSISLCTDLSDVDASMISPITEILWWDSYIKSFQLLEWFVWLNCPCNNKVSKFIFVYAVIIIYCAWVNVILDNGDECIII